MIVERPVAFLDDLEQIMPRACIERCEAEVVQDQQADGAKGADHPPVASLGASNRQFGEQLWRALIERRAIIAASFMTEGASQP